LLRQIRSPRRAAAVLDRPRAVAAPDRSIVSAVRVRCLVSAGGARLLRQLEVLDG